MSIRYRNALVKLRWDTYTMEHMEYHIYPLKLYLRKLPVVIMVSCALILNIFSWLWLVLQIPMDLEQVFLHYTILFGVDQIGRPQDMYITPAIGASIIVVNTIVGWMIYRKDWFFSYSLLAIMIAVQAAVAVTSVLIVFLNI